MATNIKKEEAANAPKARAAALQTELNKLENTKVSPAMGQPVVTVKAAGANQFSAVLLKTWSSAC